MLLSSGTFSQSVQLHTVTHRRTCEYCDSSATWGGLTSPPLAEWINKHLPLLLLQVKLRTSARSPVQTDKGISAPFAPSVWIRRRCFAPRCTTKASGTQPFFGFLWSECSVPDGPQSALKWSPKMVSRYQQTTRWLPRLLPSCPTGWCPVSHQVKRDSSSKM